MTPQPNDAPKRYDINGKLIDYQAIDKASSDDIPKRYDINGRLIGPSASQVSQANPVIRGTNAVVKNLSSAPDESLSEGGSWSDLIPAGLTAAASFIPGGMGMRIVAPAAAATAGQFAKTMIDKGPSNMNLDDLQNEINSGALTAGMGLASEGAMALLGLIKRGFRARQLNKINAAQDEGENMRLNVTGEKTPAGAVSLEDRIAPFKQREDVAWDKTRQNADNNMQTFQVPGGPSSIINPNTGQPVPTTKSVQMAGPIKVSNNVQAFIDGVGQQVADMYQHLPDYAKTDLAPLMSTMQKIKQAGITTDKGDHYIPFELAHELRSNMGALSSVQGQINLRNINKSVGQSRGGALIDQFRDALTDDMTNSMANEWGTPGAAQDFGKAVGLTKERVKAGIFDKAVGNRTNFGTGRLDINGLIDDINNHVNPLFGEFSATDRANITKALRSIGSVSPDWGGSFSYDNNAFVLRNAYSAVHSPVRLGMAVGAREMAEKVLLNPQYARVLATMPALPPNSAQASMLTKTILGALKGSAVYLITPQGGKIEAHIDQNGKPVPDFQAK